MVLKVGDERSEAHVLELLKVVVSWLATAAVLAALSQLGNLDGLAASSVVTLANEVRTKSPDNWAHTAATTSRRVSIADALKARCVLAEVR
jgi:hypothetical protein